MRWLIDSGTERIRSVEWLIACPKVLITIGIAILWLANVYLTVLSRFLFWRRSVRPRLGAAAEASTCQARSSRDSIIIGEALGGEARPRAWTLGYLHSRRQDYFSPIPVTVADFRYGSLVCDDEALHLQPLLGEERRTKLGGLWRLLGCHFRQRSRLAGSFTMMVIKLI